MNAPHILTTVTLTPTVPTPKDHSTARVTMVTRVMESRAMVSILLGYLVNKPFRRLVYWRIMPEAERLSEK